MSLTSGEKLGLYEILAPLGAGGMGEVYCARDTRLDRDVAIKVLPEALARDQERILRFEREAKLLASLNHPGIASIYGFEEAQGKRFLVLEYVEGETLAARLKRGPLPIEEALGVGRRVAEAVEAAHQKSIIHRDLKPGNVMIRADGAVKVLDFGLGRAMTIDSSSTMGSENSPTITADHTRPGMVLGTAAYMSPEQARGKPIDKRTDIWSFGVLLYECLSGARPFQGETNSDLIARILEREPDWRTLPVQTPATIQLLLRRCLAKDRLRRLRDIGDACVEIENAIADPTSSALGWANVAVEESSKPRGRWPKSAVIAWSLCLVLTLVLGWFAFGRARESGSGERRVVRLSIPAPAANYRYGSLAISPDGRFIVQRLSGVDGDLRLRLRPLNDFTERILPTTEGAYVPFVSPQSDAIAFFTETDLRFIPIAGGSSQRLCDAFGDTTGAWGPDGIIVFSTSRKGQNAQPGLSRVAASGGVAEILTSSDPAKGERVHVHPSFLPDRKHVLFTIEGAKGSSLAVLSLETREYHVILDDAAQPIFVPPGLLVFHHVDSLQLFAVPFDPATQTVTNRRVQVMGDTTWQAVLSGDGTLAYMSLRNDEGSTVVWVDREGKISPLVDKPWSWAEPRLSPDGTKLLIRQVNSPDCILWMFDMDRRILSRLTFEGDVHEPEWSADGRSALAGIEGSGTRSLYRIPIDGGSAPERLWGSDGPVFPGRGCADGSLIPLAEELAPRNRDIWVVSMSGEVKAEPFLQSSFNEQAPAFSPDGMWMAYTSDESGREEVYVRSYPSRGSKTQISIDGGGNPLWSRNGKELFYFRQQALMAVEVTTDPTLAVTPPRKLFEGDFATYRQASYDVSPDGQRFVVIKSPEGRGKPQEVLVILNWTEELKAKMATK